MNEMKIINKEKLADFLKALGSDHEVIVPAIENGNLMFGNMGSVKMEASFNGRPLVTPKEYFFPQPDWILDAINERILPLKGHKNKIDFSTDKSITLNKEGV